MRNAITLLVGGGLLAGAVAVQAQPVVFAPAVIYTTGSMPRNVVVADVNRDGRPDALTANFGSSTVRVLLGNGNGIFQPALLVNAGGTPSDLAVADVNADGKPDVLTALYSSNAAGVLLGNGDGTFQPVVTYATGTAAARPYGIAVADVTGDGRPDMVTANANGYNVSLFAGTGTGTFQPASNYALSANAAPLDVTATDLNADGRPDVLIASAGSNALYVLQGLSSSSSFQPGPYVVGPGSAYAPFGVAAGDVNGDGRPDAVTANPGNSTISVLLNTGSSLGAATIIQNSGSAENVAVGDVNGDGRNDLLTANPNDQAVAVLLGTGAGTFQLPTRYQTGGNPIGLAVADVNGDGRPDVLATNYGTGTLSVLLNTTPLPTRPALPGATASLAPNPTGAAATLHVAGLPATVAQVQATVLDATGREVARQQLAARQGAVQAELATAGLAPGLYVVRLLGFDAHGGLVGELPTQRLSVK